MDLTKDNLEEWIDSVFKDAKLEDVKNFIFQQPLIDNDETETETTKTRETLEEYTHRTADDYDFDWLHKLAKRPFKSLSEDEQRSLKYKAGMRAQFINNELSHHINTARKLAKLSISELADIEILVPKEMLVIISHAVEKEYEYLKQEILASTIVVNAIEETENKTDCYIIHMNCFLWEHDYTKVNIEGEFRHNIAGEPEKTTKDIIFNIGVRIFKKPELQV